ncbi:tyrosine-type recombinase/integrase [Pasteurella testudinis]|uniref:tyrosine-type recombinase/integrase n=1 Tax=Pasteurella testudinis TaxID=761 RepID=UPI004058B657
MRHCKALLYFAMQENLVSLNHNPFCGKLLPEGKKIRKVLDDKKLYDLDHILESDRLPAYLQPTWFIKAIIAVFKYTAIRRSQLLKLAINDINLERRTIFLSASSNKNHDDHIVPISGKLYPHVDKVITEARKIKLPNYAQLFNINRFCLVTKRKGLDMNDNQLSHLFMKLHEQTTFVISPHRFRHTVATNLMRDPERNLYVTQKLLGHKSIKTTLGYIEHDVDMLRDCVERL